MEELSTFDKLVDELSKEERRELLHRIENTVSVSTEPLQNEGDEGATADSEIAYQALNPFVKFLYALKGLLMAKKGKEAYEETLLSRLKRQITHNVPKLIDFRQALFLDRMKTELEGLRDSAAYFGGIISRAFEKDRGEFIAFLVRCHCEALAKRLEEETDPRNLVAERTISQEADLKAAMDKRFQEIITQLKEEDRKSIYLDYQSIDYLREFCESDFNTLLGHFSFDKVRETFACPFGEVNKRILHLAEVLKSARLPPSKIGLKALFIYTHPADPAKETDYEDFLKKEFATAEEALVRIRLFNKRIPLGLVIKGLMNDYNYKVEGIKGGEDWFVLFKKYWAGRLAELFREYTRELRTSMVIDKALEILGIKKFEEIKYYNAGHYEGKLKVTHWRSLSFLLGFYKSIYVPYFSRSLKILFINGEFYKTENRIELTDTYNFLNTINEKLFLFEKQLSPSGEIGKPMEDIKKEKAPRDAIFRKFEPFLKRADSEALLLIERTVFALQTLNKILNGILYSEAGGKYDTLSNISYIGGKDNPALRKDWEKIISISYEVYQVLKEIRGIEAPK